MGEPDRSPDLLGLTLFLGVHYACGYTFGDWLTGSIVGAVAIALAAPGFSLVVVSIFLPAPKTERPRLER